MNEVKVSPLTMLNFYQTLAPILKEAKGVIWDRIQSGKWQNGNEAIIGIGILRLINKAMDETERLSQLYFIWEENDKGGSQ